MNDFNPEIVIKNANVYNSYFKAFKKSDVYILNGNFLYIDENLNSNLKASKTIDANGKYMIPGLIDIHMHIESSMVSPVNFSNHMAKCGVTTIVSEPHEMANVAGIDGITAMIEAGKNSKIDIFYGIPSCVPASSEDLETTGGIINFEEMKELKKIPEVACVGEVMNYRQIIQPNNLEISKFIDYVKQEDPNFPIEGHCPQLVDLDLAKFLYLGINADHTEHNLEEIRQRFANGMFVEIQDKMLSPEIIQYIIENNLYEYFSFVTDDVMADTLYYEGHLNCLLKKAISFGMKPEIAIYCSTYTPSRRMNMLDRGTLSPGKIADFILLDNIENFEIDSTYKRGNLIYNKEISENTQPNAKCFPKQLYNSIKLRHQNKNSLYISVKEDIKNANVNVMEINDNSTKTNLKNINMPLKNGLLDWKNSNCLLTAVYERYGKNNNVGLGFLTGCCHKKGTVATSYAHDNHNILVAGSNIDDMILAVNRIIDLQGGMVVVDNGEIKAELQLNVGGILSEKPVSLVAKDLLNVRNAMIELGYEHYNPIMSFGTLTLTVSPTIKITDKGLIDVINSTICPLFNSI
ncbi:adenine deaminase C-terminal domain-containing protein [Miniphocaeibacter massiliensis]|uniref:adenine deaminase C-terminal domain-containing protein n=1 Tax=Miniphocaeibacter massiliensis TaxID=2041841 RepID=UPI000C07EE26|nr:adenine deaminase C-terminal domain-containing protein [Miniphocaeibacter massiliensis]